MKNNMYDNIIYWDEEKVPILVFGTAFIFDITPIINRLLLLYRNAKIFQVEVH